MLKIAGYNPNSFVDYPGHIAAAVFFGGCNLDCWFCHNRWLLTTNAYLDSGEILEKISDAAGFIDGVVISGGEPALENPAELIGFIKRIKSLGLKVKLDTNGTRSDNLESLLPYIDYAAMDIKAPLSKYRDVTCVTDAELLSIKKSISVLMRSGIDYEFRTTFIPTLKEEDILEIAYTISGCRRYYLQQFVETDCRVKIDAHPPKYIMKTAEKIRTLLPFCEIRGI